MYTGQSQRGLGMYGAGSRFGLGDATVNVADVDAVAAALGVTATNSGYPNFAALVRDVQAKGPLVQTQQGTPIFRGGATPFAFVSVWLALRQLTTAGYLPTAAQVMQLLTPGGNVLTPGPQPGNLPVSAFDWAQFTNNVDTFAPIMADLFAAALPGEVAPITRTPTNAPPVEAVWRDALAAGAITTPSGAQVPTSFILEGPTTLPDGNVYVRFHDIVGESRGGNSTPVWWWKGPTWRTITSRPSNGQVKVNGGIFDIPDPGTGDWYLNAVVYGTAAPLSPPPSWTGTYTLPADILASLLLSDGSLPTPAPIVQFVTPQPAAPAPGTSSPGPQLYRDPTMPPPTPPTAPGTVVPPPSPAPVLYASVPTVPAATTPQPPPTTNVYLYQSAGQNGPDAGAVPVPVATDQAQTGGLALVGLGLLALAIAGGSSSRKRARR